MGLIFNRGSDNRCTTHHYPDEWEKTEKIDVVTPQDINRHEDDFGLEPFHTYIYEEKKKKCMHENCHSTKRKWVRVNHMYHKDFDELVRNGEEFYYGELARMVLRRIEGGQNLGGIKDYLKQFEEE